MDTIEELEKQLTADEKKMIEKRSEDDFLYTLVFTADTEYRDTAYDRLIDVIIATYPQLPPTIIRDFRDLKGDYLSMMVVFMYAMYTVPDFALYVDSRSRENAPVLAKDAEDLITRMLQGVPAIGDAVMPPIPLTVESVVCTFRLKVYSRFDPYGMCREHLIRQIIKNRKQPQQQQITYH